MIQKKSITYTYSQLSSESLKPLVEAHYPMLTPISCKFYVRGLHDNYLIESGASQYILRIYRNAWRNTSAILFELELLAFLREQKAPVSSPTPTIEDELGFFIDYHDGKRMAALFDFADGHLPEPRALPQTCKFLGHSVAKVHLAAANFVTTHDRPILDTPYLLDDSLAKIEPFLSSKQLSYITTLQKRIHAEMPSLSRENGGYGICTGDINFRNFHINDNNEVTLFDFDQCGYGYRAFEIGKFQSAMHHLAEKDNFMKIFLEGYQQVRPLSEADLRAIPYFEILSIIWVLTIYVDNSDFIGHILLKPSFWKQRIDRLKELESQLYSSTPTAQ